MVAKNLEFFDKNGYNLNLNWNEQRQIWEGNIFFPRVSVGLYENTTIYIVECKEQDSDYNDDICTYPTGDGNIVFKWDLANSFVDEFFMFNFDEDYEIKDTSSLVHRPYDGPICETLIVNRFDKYIVPLLDSSQDIDADDLLEIHVAFKADESSVETTYKRTLIMSYEKGYTTYEIARITFYAETIEEDERLKIWNENLGYNLKPEDTIIFKHSDLHEHMPDYELLNEKRKELMLEGHNIYPYIGSYKALLNAIKFFGYDNLNIVEYWRNINEYDSEFGRIYRTYVYSLKNKKTLSTKRKPITLNTKNFQKLNNISIVYNINHPETVDGKKYDEYGLPNVIEDFDKNKRDDFILNIEEALVKLFALKNKLNDEFMPGSTKVVDVIGEANYFGINLIGNNPQISSINYVESKGHVDFTVFPNKYCHITENEDFVRYIARKKNIDVDEQIGSFSYGRLQDLIDEYGDSDSIGNIHINDLDKRSLRQVLNDLIENEQSSVCKIYEDYYNITYDNRFDRVEEQEREIRDIPDARNIYKDIVLDDVDSDPYGSDDYDVPDMDICAKVVLKGEFDGDIDSTSTIEWKITHSEKPWTATYSGDVKKYGSVFVQLPYLGNYTVEMTVWDSYNHCSKQYREDAIVVEPYNIEIKGFYYDKRPLPDNLKYDLFIPPEYLEESNDEFIYYLWAKKDGDATNGIITYTREPNEMSLSDIIGEYVIDGDELDEYIGIENLRDVEKESWVCIVNTESDDRDTLKISWLHNGGHSTISYGVDEYKFVEALYDPFGESEAYNPEMTQDAIYHVIKKNVDNMYSWALQEHLNSDDINSSMRSYRMDGSVNVKGPYYKYDVDTILYRINKGYKEYDHLNEEIINLNPGKYYEYVRYINNTVNIKPLTWVLLGFDYTRITGRLINDQYPKWTLTMIGDALDPDENLREDKVITTHNGLYFTYLFENEGIYKIKLELMDIEYNIYETEKPLIIVDKDANYEMYHTLNDEYENYLNSISDRNSIYLNYR